MSTPLIWVGLPLGMALLLLLPWSPRLTSRLGGLLALLLAALAIVLPIDEAFNLGPLSVKIESVFNFLGRQIILNAKSRSLLALFYSLTGIWALGAHAAGISRRLVPLSMAVVALLISALAVKPFLYAALLIETAILLIAPLLVPPRQKPDRGIIRFVTYQTLALPFILFSGWLLAGVEASPSDLALAKQSAALLGLGFAFLLGVFPLYTWMPMLSEQAHPYIFGFLQWTLPIASLLFGMGFLDRYAWLRDSEQLPQTLRLIGLIMVASGGLWAAFEKRMERIPAYAAVTDTGCALLALSLGGGQKVQVISLLFIPRAFGLAVWSLGISVLKNENNILSLDAIHGLARKYPLAVSAIIAAHLSAAGLPMLAGFPPRLALWEGLANASLGAAFWFGLGLLGLFLSAIRTLSALVMATDLTYWQSQETWNQRLLLGAGIGILILLGLFPQIMQILLSSFPLLFEQLSG